MQDWEKIIAALINTNNNSKPCNLKQGGLVYKNPNSMSLTI